MGGIFLSIDLGNSHCKVCLLEGGRPPREHVRLPSDGRVVQALLAALEDLPPVGRAALSSVADPELEEALARALVARLGMDLAVNPDSGLTLALEAPETVGHDRLYAARGALERVGAPALVVDAGTALTVDALGPGPGEGGGGVFLGGAIAPGPDLLAGALARGGARLPLPAVGPGLPALGRDTPRALAAGVCVGFEGAALRLVERLAAEAGLGSAPVVLTGGARGYLTEVLFLPGRDLVVAPHLVHEGLAAACGAHGSGGR